jgi:hypothetical protein
MALPKSFKPLDANFTPGDPNEALAKEIIDALKQAAGQWHVAKRFRTAEAAAEFGTVLERCGNERVEVDVKGCIVRARALPQPAAHVVETTTLAEAGFANGPVEMGSGDVIDTSERKARGRAT